MAESPPEQRKPTDPAPPVAPGQVPQLLVMPPTDAIPSMVWPGSDDKPAWAIPVQIPAGTRGYALFVPMVPVQAPDADSVEEKASAPEAGPEAAVPDPTKSGVDEDEEDEDGDEEDEDGDEEDEDGDEEDEDDEDSVPAEAGVGAGTLGPKRPAPDTSIPPAPPIHPWGVPQPPVRPFPVYQPRESSWQRFREKHWPGPVRSGGRAVPVGVLAGALGFLAFLPLDRTGIGWFLAAVALIAGVVNAVRRSADLSHSERWIRSGWAVAALALLLVPAFRNAWWLVTFSVFGALGCAALAIVGGRQIRSILFSLVAVPIAALRGLPWVRSHLQPGRNPGIARRVVFSIGLTVAVLLVFGALLTSADVAFSTLLDRIVPDFDFSGGTLFRWIFLATLGGLIAVAGVYTLSAPPTTSSLDTPGKGRFGLVEWAPACSALVLLFAGFVAVQFTVLFGGRRHVLKTAGLGYAEYARSGFWQLVAVTLLSLAVLAALARWARRDQPLERVLLRVLLGLVCGLSVVIVASALSRMWEYQRVYSFTGERIFVMSFEMLLGVVFVLIAAAGVRWQGRWIPQATVGLAVLMLLGLAVLGPEGYAADRNAVRYEKTGKIDAWYLRALSADATPALTRLPDPVRRCTLSWIAEDLKEPDPWYAWNLGRWRARQALKDLGPDAIGKPADCRAADQYDLPKKRR
ncbi:DUF4153 domain-containing protein [Actinoplanes regularis]|uniref:DUF4153 domain-containing protein n=1 Tax=Actinoplanes regularis TaxID=52697 RepID=UPI0024A4A874|nr:DUF4153 domain-containing protein [Actinoplanes regularis]GLW31951.1 hypothetical protein Areg01_48900 [Actinoplanes regularis]